MAISICLSSFLHEHLVLFPFSLCLVMQTLCNAFFQVLMPLQKLSVLGHSPKPACSFKYFVQSLQLSTGRLCFHRSYFTQLGLEAELLTNSCRVTFVLLASPITGLKKE